MDVVIIGAGGQGKVVLDILRAGGKHRPVGFIDADPSLSGKSVGGVEVLGKPNFLPRLKSMKVKGVIVAIGDNRTRQKYARMAAEHGLELLNAVHPSAVVSESARIGRNVVIAAGAVISAEAKIGDSVIVNTSAVVDHESEIGEAVHVCPCAAVAGRVRVGEMAFIGLGCRIIQCLRVGSAAIVGAGAVVIEDVPDGATVVGVPARVIKMASSAGVEAATV